MDILNQMIARAKANPQRIVLPEGDEPRTLEAANILLKDKIAQLILIGNPETIKGMADGTNTYTTTATQITTQGTKVAESTAYGTTQRSPIQTVAEATVGNGQSI